MTPEQQNLETTIWDVATVDAEVKLYLLALVRTADSGAAQRLSGLDDHAAGSARGWLRQVGVLRPDGSVNEDRLREARTAPLEVAAA